jgi:hypothetical protein
LTGSAESLSISRFAGLSYFNRTAMIFGLAN